MNAKGLLVVATVLVAAIGGAYAVGDYRGHRAERVELTRRARQDTIDDLAQQLRTSAPILLTEHRETAAAVKQDSVLSAAHAVARARIHIVNDSQIVVVGLLDSLTAGGRDTLVAVDSGNPIVNNPKEEIAAIRASDATIAQKDVTIGKQAAELQTLYRRDTLHVTTERLLRQQLEESKPQRCGRRCGFVAGVTTAAAVAYVVTHPANVSNAVKWIIRLVP